MSKLNDNCTECGCHYCGTCGKLCDCDAMTILGDEYRCECCPDETEP